MLDNQSMLPKEAVQLLSELTVVSVELQFEDKVFIV